MLARHTFAAFLFDMDGTLINSITATERVWTRWALGRGLDAGALLPTIHGVRCVDTVRRLNIPGVNPEHEAERIAQMEMDDVEGVTSIEGAAEFLKALPADRWAVVTSAPRLLAERRIEAAGLTLPHVMVTAEDVERGKPAPDCFQLAAKKLGVDADDCLVFEDAPAGIAAAEAAGASVMVITATHAHPVSTSHPTLTRYDSGTVSITEQGWLRLGTE